RGGPHRAPHQGGPVQCSGSHTASAPTVAATAHQRNLRLANHAHTPATANSTSTPPILPPGTLTCAPGRAAHQRATWSSHHAGGPAQRTSSSAPPDQNGPTPAARTPNSRAGATAGAASR